MRKELLNYSKFLVSALFVIYHSNVMAQWTQVGANLGFASSGSSSSLSINPATNETYIAYPDGATHAFIVQKFNGTSWVQVGANLGFASNNTTPSITFNPVTNEPYIAYSDGAANAFVIQKFNGTSWAQIGANLGFASSGSTPSIQFNPSSKEVYVAYRDGAANAFLVQRFNGTAWVQVGANLGFASNGAVPTIAFNPTTSDAYLAYPDGALHAYIVQKFNGTAWVQVGANLGFASSYVAASIAFNFNTSEIYLAYPDGALNAFVVQKFNGSIWSQAGLKLGFASSGMSNITAPALAYSITAGKIFIAYPDGSSHTFILQSFDGTSWTQIGTGTGATGGNTVVSLAFKKCSAEAYIAFPDAAANAFKVQRYNLGCTLTVTTQPQNKSVNSGNPAWFAIKPSFTCVTYKWQRNAGAGYKDLTDSGQYWGTAKDTLKVINTTLANSGNAFRCIVTSGTCADTSDIATLTVIDNSGIEKLKGNNYISLFPNPTSEWLTIMATSGYNNEVYTISDIYGRIIERGIVKSNTVINTASLAPAIYYLIIGNNREVIKFLKIN